MWQPNNRMKVFSFTLAKALRWEKSTYSSGVCSQYCNCIEMNTVNVNNNNRMIVDIFTEYSLKRLVWHEKKYRITSQIAITCDHGRCRHYTSLRRRPTGFLYCLVRCRKQYGALVLFQRHKLLSRVAVVKPGQLCTPILKRFSAESWILNLETINFDSKYAKKLEDKSSLCRIKLAYADGMQIHIERFSRTNLGGISSREINFESMIG